MQADLIVRLAQMSDGTFGTRGSIDNDNLSYVCSLSKVLYHIGMLEG